LPPRLEHPTIRTGIATRPSGIAAIDRRLRIYRVIFGELTGAERDRFYTEQGGAIPALPSTKRQTVGIRTIPVLELTAAWRCAAARLPHTRVDRGDLDLGQMA
jgi:hypothetical protein